MVNWINSWKSGNKKNKYSFTIRMGKLTFLDIKVCPCDTKSCSKFRLIILNLGFEI
jgi:hypothetical protein